MEPLPRREKPRHGVTPKTAKRRPAVVAEHADRFGTINHGDRGDSDRLSNRSHRDH